MKTTQRYRAAFDRFRHDYEAGKASGFLHGDLSPHFKAENARKCAEGIADTGFPRVWAYWSGYRDAMEIVGQA